jgi:hypothetical protein
MYSVGWPFWKVAARMGVTLLIRLDAVVDKEADVVVLTSPDIKGLIVEVPTKATAQEAHKEINDCIDMMMRELLKQPPKAKPVTTWPGEMLAA